MEYISIKEASELWGIDTSNIGKLCRKGKIEGAKLVGKSWLIPKYTAKPVDGRTRQAKQTDIEPSFRFPLFVNFPESEFIPALSKEEKKLRQAQADLYACDFQKSRPVLEQLAENAEDIYVKICAIFYMCVLCVEYDNDINWEKYFLEINRLLLMDFPRKKEMELFLPWLDFVAGQFSQIPMKLNEDGIYAYHPSAWYLNAFLSAFNYNRGNTEAFNIRCAEPFVTLCRLMERDGYYVEAQELHMTLFFYYHSVIDTQAMYYHLKKAVHIAYERNLLLAVADAETYYSEEMHEVLCDYPDSFAEKIQKNSRMIYDNFSCFSIERQNGSMYAKLSRSDFPYIFYAFSGFTNKKVAELCCISPRNVASQYEKIYTKLGIKGKKELINEMRLAFGDMKFGA